MYPLRWCYTWYRYKCTSFTLSQYSTCLFTIPALTSSNDIVVVLTAAYYSINNLCYLLTEQRVLTYNNKFLLYYHLSLTLVIYICELITLESASWTNHYCWHIWKQECGPSKARIFGLWFGRRASHINHYQLLLFTVHALDRYFA